MIMIQRICSVLLLVPCMGIMGQGIGCRAHGVGFWVLGFGFWVYGFGLINQEYVFRA